MSEKEHSMRIDPNAEDGVAMIVALLVSVVLLLLSVVVVQQSIHDVASSAQSPAAAHVAERG